MRKFIIVCFDLLEEAKKHGSSMKELYVTALDGGMPRGPLSTFSTYYWQIRKMTPKQREAELKPKKQVVND